MNGAKKTRKKAKPIRRTTGKGGNYRPTKSGAGMTRKGVKAYRKANPAQNSKQPLQAKLKKVDYRKKGVSLIVQGHLDN